MIQIVETKDYALLATLNEEIQRFHHQLQPDIFKPYDKVSIEAFFKNCLEREQTHALIAQEQHTALAYVLLFEVNIAENPFQYARRFLLLDQISVLQHHRRKGIGSLLLEATFSFAKEHHFDFVELNHWTQNDQARNFFGMQQFTYYNEKMRRAVE